SRPHLEALQAMRRAYALVLLGHGGKADSVLYTGKIYEYLTSGRPVLGILDSGPAADVILEAGAGAVVRPGEVASTAQAIEGLLRSFRAGQDSEVRPPFAPPSAKALGPNQIKFQKRYDCLLTPPSRPF